MTGSLTAGAAVRVVGVGGTGGGRTELVGPALSPVLTDLLTATHLSIVLSLATGGLLSLRVGEGPAADLSFARVDIGSWVMEEVTVC